MRKAKISGPIRPMRYSVHLRLDPEVVELFKGGGKGHITRMQAVLRAYVDAHKRRAGGSS
jgi:uncharacterized protein (DUF4415 family)